MHLAGFMNRLPQTLAGLVIAAVPQGGSCMIRYVVAAVAVVASISAVMAQQDVAATRQAVMKQSGKAFYGTLSAISRGQKGYDQAEVDAALTELEAASKQYVSVFPDGSKASVPGSKFGVSAKAWENKADLEAKAAASAQRIAGFKGQIKDVESLKAAVSAISASCDSCHESYRIRN